MAKTIYFLAASLDGFLARPDGDLDWLTGFKGRALPGVEATTQQCYAELIENTGVLVTGSGTFEWLMDHENDWPYEQPTFLFSTRELDLPEGRDIRTVRGAVADHHAEIMAAGGGRNVWLVGGGQLAIQYQRAGLLDELHLTIVPVFLGEGMPAFAGEIAGELELIDSTVFSHGMVGARYRMPAGD